MTVELHDPIWFQTTISSDEKLEVTEIGNALLKSLNTPSVLSKINKANAPKISSALVQEAFLIEALNLGFTSEKKGLFANIPTQNLRPDYYRKVGENSGIIIEVERGKTIMNNMDILDMWKCHLCEKANHLFLFVPKALKHNDKSKPYDCFRIAANRLAPFFEEKNYTNVRSLWLFGY